MKKPNVFFTLLVLLFAVSCSNQPAADGPRATYPFNDPKLELEKRVDDLVGRMTIEEKVGQMTQVARDYLSSESDIKKYFLGSILSGGGSVPGNNTPAGWRAMIKSYQDNALATRLGIPILYGIDAVHGHNNAYGAVIFPHNIGLGAARDADLAFRIARATTVEMLSTGIPWTFAPCVAVVQDVRWGRTYEGYSKDPSIGNPLALAAVRGIQGETLGETGALASVKHFAGDGGTKGGVDRADTIVTEAQLESLHLAPYAEALKAGPGSIMASFSSVNGVKMHENSALINDWLKTKHKFAGLVVSDWGAVQLLPQIGLEKQVAAAVNAGIDIVMVPDAYVDFINALLAAVKSGAVKQERIDDAVKRIVRVKFQIGLFEKPIPYEDKVDKLAETFASDAHKAIAREAVQKSFTLLKNEKNVLPLPTGAKAKKLLVVGAKADDIGVLCGGWTMSWQGSSGAITPGETLLKGLEKTFGEANVQHSVDGSISDGFKPDVVVFVPGEQPYAEMKGDSQTIEVEFSDADLWTKIRKDAALKSLPVVTLVVSGRPLVMNEILQGSTAFAALWLPGSQAGAVADVLAGAVKPTGKLPHPWPATADQTKSVLPLGFGLTY